MGRTTVRSQNDNQRRTRKLMTTPGNLERGKLKSLAGVYRERLLKDVMPFWEAWTRDEDHGAF